MSEDEPAWITKFRGQLETLGGDCLETARNADGQSFITFLPYAASEIERIASELLAHAEEQHARRLEPWS